MLANPYLIMQICLAVRVLEPSSIDEIIEARRMIDIELIRDTANPLAQLVR